MNVSKEIIKSINISPKTFGIYNFKDKKNEIIYIGKARNIRNRLKSYLSSGVSVKTSVMLSVASSVEWQICGSEAEAILLESSLIKKHKPRYNILLKDDKSFPEIFIDDKSEFPRIQVHRGKRVKEGSYWGPFADRKSVTKVIEFLQKSFKLRDCTDFDFKSRSRPCLKYYIKRCSAPCVGKVSGKDYIRKINEAKEVLSGNWSDMRKQMEKDMIKFAENMQFERAAHVRDRLADLSSIIFLNSVDGLKKTENADIFYYHELGGLICIGIKFIRNGNDNGSVFLFPESSDNRILENDYRVQAVIHFYDKNPLPKQVFLCKEFDDDDAKLIEEVLNGRSKVSVAVPKSGKWSKIVKDMKDAVLEEMRRHSNKSNEIKQTFMAIKSALGLSAIPVRIEAFDNSHLFGSGATGGMVVANQSGLMKNAYRKYNFQTDHKGDDYGMMYEMLSRRARAIIESGESNNLLWVIDGGKIQMSAAMKASKENGLKVDILSICKQESRVSGKEKFMLNGNNEIKINFKDKVRFFFQMLRDEVHNLSIRSQRKKHAKGATKSALDDIPGVGPKTKSLLLQRFGGVEKIKNASLEEISRVEGVGNSKAKLVFDFFRNN